MDNLCFDHVRSVNNQSPNDERCFRIVGVLKG